MVATPRLAISTRHHVFADKRNFFGVPNTLNVITNFPFLVVGVVGLVLSLHGNYLGVSVRGEVWGWIFFYMGIAGTAFGSAYYHLKLGFRGIKCRTFNDMRLYMIIHIAPFVNIPVLALLFPRYHVLANILTLADKKIYGVTRYVVGGHLMGHLSFSVVAITLTVMLWFRNIKMTRASAACVGLQFTLFMI